MSYSKALRHARNVRKCRKQGRMYFGFETGSRWKNPRRNPATAKAIVIHDWFRQRHGTADQKYIRECIREAIADLRLLRAAPRND